MISSWELSSQTVFFHLISYRTYESKIVLESKKSIMVHLFAPIDPIKIYGVGMKISLWKSYLYEGF